MIKAEHSALPFAPPGTRKGNSVPLAPQGVALKAALTMQNGKRDSEPLVSDTFAKLEVAPHVSAVGFLVVDSSLEPMSFNAEAVRILTYPSKVADVKHLDLLLAEKIRTSLVRSDHAGGSPFVSEFQSGRRRYFCRVLSPDSQFKGSSCVVVLLERGPAGLAPLSQITERFKLTRREREVLGLLLQGLTSKEMASRLNISPNTVKVFLRLIMTKMGVSSRSAVLPKIIMMQSH